MGTSGFFLFLNEDICVQCVACQGTNLGKKIVVSVIRIKKALEI